MGIPVIVYGKSGSGKSRSLKNFAADEIMLVNVARKPLPFRGSFKYVLKTDNYEIIKQQLAKMLCKTAVIDDAGYLQTNAFMRGHSQPKKGSSSFDLFNAIADAFWGLIRFIADTLPEDVIVYITMHEQGDELNGTKLKTIGKLLDEKVCIEGMVSICLRCMTDGERHWFSTQSNGIDIAKAPEDMFEKEIDNDLKMVDTTIREYWNLGGKQNG